APVAALEGSQARLEGGARWVARPGVLVTLVLPHRLLGEGGGLEDRNDDRAGHRLWILSGVDGERLESGFAPGVLHHFASMQRSRARTLGPCSMLLDRVLLRAPLVRTGAIHEGIESCALVECGADPSP